MGEERNALFVHDTQNALAFGLGHFIDTDIDLYLFDIRVNSTGEFGPSNEEHESRYSDLRNPKPYDKVQQRRDEFRTYLGVSSAPVSCDTALGK